VHLHCLARGPSRGLTYPLAGRRGRIQSRSFPLYLLEKLGPDGGERSFSAGGPRSWLLTQGIGRGFPSWQRSVVRPRTAQGDVELAAVAGRWTTFREDGRGVAYRGGEEGRVESEETSSHRVRRGDPAGVLPGGSGRGRCFTRGAAVGRRWGAGVGAAGAGGAAGNDCGRVDCGGAVQQDWAQVGPRVQPIGEFT